jgi:MFS family permease
MPLQRNLTLLTGMSLLQGMVFYSPVATLYRVQNGLSLSEFFLIEALSWALTLASEVPWGLVADRVGARRTLVWGHGLFLVTKVIFAVATGFAGFLAERLLLALAVGALSGCDSALVHRSSPPGTSGRAFARIEAAALAGMVVAGFVGPWLAGFSLRWTAWATVVPYALAWGLSWFLVDPAPAVRRPLVWNRELRRTVLAFGRLFSGGPGRALTLASLALGGEVVHLVLVFLAQLLYQRAGIPTSAFGILFLALQLVPMVALAAVPLDFGARPRAGLVATTAVSAVLIAVLGWSWDPLVTVGAVILLAVVSAATRPLASTWQNGQVSGGSRATTLSVFALWSEGVSAGSNAALGAMPNGNLAAVMVVCASLVAVAALGIAVSGGRVSRR